MPYNIVLTSDEPQLSFKYLTQEVFGQVVKSRLVLSQINFLDELLGTPFKWKNGVH